MIRGRQLVGQAPHEGSARFPVVVVGGDDPGLGDRSHKGRANQPRGILAGNPGGCVEHEIQRPERRRTGGRVAEQQRRGLGVHDIPGNCSAANRLVEIAPDVDDSLLHQGRPQCSTELTVSREHELANPRRLLDDEGALLAIALRHFREQLLQPTSGDWIIRGEIRAAEKGRAIRREEDGERPSP